MPTPTKPPPLGQHPSNKGPGLAPGTIAAAGALYALAELLAGLFIGRFFLLGRAEALLFLALRPWLLVAAALAVARLATRDRLGIYFAGLLLAAASQTLLLLALSAANPWHEALSGVLAGALLVLLIDLLVQAALRFLGRWGRAVGGLLAVLVLLLPFTLRPYEALVLERGESTPAEKRPELMLMSVLPLAWGETGPLDPNSRPAGAYQVLEREFSIRSLDVLDRRSLGSGELLLVAQPRALAPTELVALDEWVRRGGRALILTDPMLVWPSELALGDFRRPPAIGLVDPLLTHWGLSLDAPPEPRTRVDLLRPQEASRRLATFAPGTFSSRTPDCVVSEAGLIAECRIGKGRAILLADADMLHDRLWTGSAATGTERHVRLADNPLVVADYLDRLTGQSRERLAGDAEWIEPGADRVPAVLLAILPLLAAASPGVARRIRRRA